MRISPEIEKYRELTGKFASNQGDPFGKFWIPGPYNNTLQCLASDGTDEIPWDHVSVSLAARCPNWPEMCFIKSLFFDDEETVMQLHPPKSHYINNHLFCLHLWRPTNEIIPMPPIICV
jgi:hypothetical protein